MREEWSPGCGKKAAHPNARFTAPAGQCPVIDPEWENPRGVPISAIMFGGRRPSTVPLVFEAFNWRHGTFLGSIQSSETTAAAAGAVGMVRRDPMAMLPFCGYNMGDYFAHWLRMGRAAKAGHQPAIYYVNWFRKSAEGEWLWPGYGDNVRVLKWIVGRLAGTAGAVDTPIGRVPAPGALDVSGLNIGRAEMDELLKVDADAWLAEVKGIAEHYGKIGERVPREMHDELAAMERRLRER